MLPVIEKKERKPSLTNMTNIFKSWDDLQVFFKGKYKKTHIQTILSESGQVQENILKIFYKPLDHFFMALQVAVDLLL